MAYSSLPPLAPFPTTPQQAAATPVEWKAWLQSWRAIVFAHVAQSRDNGLLTAASKMTLRDETVAPFLESLARGLARGSLPKSLKGAEEDEVRQLKRVSFALLTRLWRAGRACPASLLQWPFLADVCRVWGGVNKKRRVGSVLSPMAVLSEQLAEQSAEDVAEASLGQLKRGLSQTLMAQGQANATGGNKTAVAAAASATDDLRRVNYLISAWPAAGVHFLTGSDYLEAVAGCFRRGAVPAEVSDAVLLLRKALITHVYLCLLATTEIRPAKFSQLTDVLYDLRSMAASRHQNGGAATAGSSSAGAEELLTELFSTTPLLLQLRKRAAAAAPARLISVLRDLEPFRRPGSVLLPLPPRLLKLARARREKGKGTAVSQEGTQKKQPQQQEQQLPPLHAHAWSQIFQVQDLFPDLGSAFVAKLLDEYDNDAEKVVAHLLEDNLPAHLAQADRSENLTQSAQTSAVSPPPRHRGLVDPDTEVVAALQDKVEAREHADAVEELPAMVSRLHFGKNKSSVTADDLLRQRQNTPAAKAAILSALAAFDADDDERDDTYDADDVGAVDAAIDRATAVADGDNDADTSADDTALFALYQATPAVFGRDAATRRSPERARLRSEFGMTDEAIEGWALMLVRDPQRRRRLESKMATTAGLEGFSGEQAQLAPTAWRAGGGGGSGDEDEDEDGEGGGPSQRGGYGGARGGGRGRGGRAGGGGYRGGGGRGGGNVAGPSGEKQTEAARRRKEANKSSRANHNRREGRARKMARGFGGGGGGA